MRDKIRELTRDTAIYGVSTIVGRFLNYLLVPIYTHFISTAAMGVYTNIYAYIGFLNILYIYGMEAAFMKYHSLAAPGEKPRTFSTAYLALALTAPISVRSEGPAPNRWNWSINSIIHYVFPGTQYTEGSTVPVSLTTIGFPRRSLAVGTSARTQPSATLYSWMLVFSTPLKRIPTSRRSTSSL